MQLCSALCSVLGFVSAVLAQSQYAVSGYKYEGCVEVDPGRFELTHPHPAGGRTPEDCEELCRGFAYVGVFDDACRCGNNIGPINHQDDDVCNNPCKGNAALGWCGSAGPACAKYANLYCATFQVPVSGSTTAPFWTGTTPGGYSYSDAYSTSTVYTYPYSYTSECIATPTAYVTTVSGSTYTTTPSWTLTTVTTTLGTYTISKSTSTRLTTWTTTLSGETAAYTTVTFTSTGLDVVTSAYTTTAEETYVTTTTVPEHSLASMSVGHGGHKAAFVALAALIIMVVF